MSRVLGLVVVALLFAFAFTVEARAEELPLPERGQAICERDGPRCVVRREDVAENNATMPQLLETMKAQAATIQKLEADLVKLREIKGCGKLEVLPRKVPLPTGPYRAS
jgi:hypothetical protein